MKRTVLFLMLIGIIVLPAVALDFEMISIPGTNYSMLSTEVTQKLYTEVMGYNPSHFENDNMPVEQVSWYDAVKFCNALSKIMGLTPVYTISGYNVIQDISKGGFRLPTVEEWQYAANGGENYTYAGSNNIDEIAWYGNNSDKQPHPVGQKNSNGYGLYDMSGNVCEWCWDTIPGLGGNRYRCGGSWSNKTGRCKVNSGYWDNAVNKSNIVGFRIVKNNN